MRRPGARRPGSRTPTAHTHAHAKPCVMPLFGRRSRGRLGRGRAGRAPARWITLSLVLVESCTWLTCGHVEARRRKRRAELLKTQRSPGGPPPRLPPARRSASTHAAIARAIGALALMCATTALPTRAWHTTTRSIGLDAKFLSLMTSVTRANWELRLICGQRWRRGGTRLSSWARGPARPAACSRPRALRSTCCSLISSADAPAASSSASSSTRVAILLTRR